MMRAMAQRRANEATFSLVRAGAQARAAAMTYGRAHMLQFLATSSDDANRGSVQVWRGVFNACGANDWATIIDTSACDADPNCLAEVDMGLWSTDGSYAVGMVPEDGVTQVCYEPDGDMFATGGVNAVVVNFQRTLDGVPEGVTRTVVLPRGGSPRVRN
jgi:hypothetical protein